MLPAISRYSVNWQDGMKIKSGHFVALEGSLDERMRNSLKICLDRYSYGLLPPDPESVSGFKLTCDIVPGNQIKVILLECRAVTAGGLVIERKEEEHRIPGLVWIDKIYPLGQNSEKTMAMLDVIVSVDRLSRMPIGDPDPKESPPRQPSVSPKYILKINPSGTPYNNSDELKIAEIVIENGIPKISEHYIPPCATVNCYSPLFTLYNDFRNRLELVEENCISVAQKLRSGTAPEGADSGDDLHSNLQLFAEQVLFFLSGNFEWYRRIVPSSSPLFMVEFFVHLARVINTALKVMEPGIRDILLNYFRQLGLGFEPGSFVNALNETLANDYNHVDVRSNFASIHGFFDPLVKLFEILAKRRFIDIRRRIISGFKEIA